MKFMEAIKAFYTNYATFEGRTQRSGYWWPILFQGLVFLVLSFLIVDVGGFSGTLENNENISIGGLLLLAPVALFAVANIIPSIAVGVRRLHDLNFSGWWYLAVVVLSIIPLIGILVGIAQVVFFARRGTQGPNRFGPDPLENLDEIFR